MSTGPFLSSAWYRVAALKPRLKEHAAIHRHRYRGKAWYVVNDTVTGRAHLLTPEGCVLIYPESAWDPVRAHVEGFPSFDPKASWWKRLLLGF